MSFDRLKTYFDVINRKNKFLLHSSWAVEMVYEQLQAYPSADWTEVVKRSVEIMVSKFGITETDARSHAVYALRQEGAFVVPPRIMKAQQKLKQNLEGGI